ncbi:MAG: class I SAM-dependent methyltransferase [Bacillus sp. (in: firmicutes)]
MEKVLRELMEKNGAGLINFQEYMETVLYHPTEGYYNQDRVKIGPEGDFYTNANVGKVFGLALADWFMHIWDHTSLPVAIYELGAGNGRLALAILDRIGQVRPDLYEQLSYTLVDGSRYHQTSQLLHLAGHRVVQKENIEGIRNMDGILFSNELFDALPVHLVAKQQGKFYECMVGKEGSQFKERLVPLDNPQVLVYMEERQLIIPEGYKREVPLRMSKLMEVIHKKVRKGMILTIDYGYTEEEWPQLAHPQGTIRGYKDHRLISDPLVFPGRMDLTYHIPWDVLKKDGEANQAFTVSFLPQSRFLLACGLLSHLQLSDSSDPFSDAQKQNRAIRSLIDPSQISSGFQALVQMKGTSCDPLFP